jgi:FkbM family methyltransferase
VLSFAAGERAVFELFLLAAGQGGRNPYLGAGSMQSLILAIREKYHPLHHLRRFRGFQRLTALLDVPVPIRLPLIDHPVYVSLSKNFAFVASRRFAGEEKEQLNFVRLITLGKFVSFYDIGANVGIYGFMFRNMNPAGRVTMFEPDPSNAALISKTIARQKFRNVQLIEAAVSDRGGTTSFRLDGVSGATGGIVLGASDSLPFISRHHGIAPRVILVETLALDQFASINGDPDLVKIDVEGAETAVFEGARGVITSARPAIIFECDDPSSSLISILASAGYATLDFSTLQPVDRLRHNNLALHKVRHGAILRELLLK